MTDIWDNDYEPAPWAQRDRRLSTRSEAVAELIANLAVDPRAAGRLTEVRREPSFDQAASMFLSATWADTGMPAVVKLNVSPSEMHWMLSLGERVPDLVPRVLAGGEKIGRHDVRWLALERVPHRLSHAWGDRRYDLLAEAAVRFQEAARSFDHRFVGVVCPHYTADTIDTASAKAVQGRWTRCSRGWTPTGAGSCPSADWKCASEISPQRTRCAATPHPVENARP